MNAATAPTLRLLATLAVAGFAAVAPGQDAPPEPPLRLFLDTSLNERLLRLAAITEDSILAHEENGKAAQLSRSEVLAIAPLIVRSPVLPAGAVLNVWRDPTLLDTEPLGRCDLVDGQVLPGRVWVQGSGPDSLGWESRLWGRIPLPLESISVLTLRPGGTGKRDGLTDDVVWLANGDRTGGFVSGIADTVTIEADGRRADIPAERVAGVGFANPRVSPRGEWVWLYDGTVAALSSVRVTRDGSALVQASVPAMAKQPEARLRADELRALAFDLSRLTPLADLPLSIRAAAGDRRWTPAPIVADVHAAPLGAADIELPGPMTAEWVLPAGAHRVSALCELPAACRVWGDCEVVLELVIGGETRPLWRHRFHSAEPEAPFNVMLGNAPVPAGAVLRVRLNPGENGPIQDRIIIRRGLVLIDGV